MLQVESFIVDLDDTLYPEGEYVKSGFRSVAGFLASRTRHDEEELFAHLFQGFKSGVRGGSFDRLREAFPTDVPVPSMVEAYRAHDPEISFFPDALEFLERFSPEQTMILLTDGHPGSQRRKIKALDVARFFDRMYVSDEYGITFRKPSPEIYETIIEETGIDPRTTCAIGDNPHKDFKTPNAMDMLTVCIRRDTNVHSMTGRPEEYSPQHIFPDFREFMGFLQRKGCRI